MSKCRNKNGQKHHHRGKSSESLLDKAQILDGLSITKGQVILDAGCGNGYMAKEFAKLTGKTGKVYALDPDFISIESLKSETIGSIIDPFVGDITKETKLAPSSIDLIYLSTVIHGFSKLQMEGVLREIRRLLKPKGKIGILEIKKEKTPFGPPLEMRFSPMDLEQAIDLTPILLIEVAEYFYLQMFEN